MNGTEQVNWVARKAECLLPDVFQQLQNIARRDIGEAQQKSPLRSDFTFTCSEVNQIEFVVVRKSKPNTLPTEDYSVTFTLNHDSIRVDVFPPSEVQNGFFHILATWMPAEGRCRLTIDRQPYELWQISQKALDRLVFHAPR